MTRRWAAAAAVAGLASAALAWAAGADAPGAALQARHAELAPRLAASPFQRPLLLQSNASAGAPFGEIHAVLDHGFDTVSRALRSAAHWCDVLLLQTNIQRCVPEGEGGGQRLAVAVARRYTDPVEAAETVVFRYELQAAQPAYLAVALRADQGPVGTRDYRLRFEATPLDAHRTFVHLSYAYTPGLLARLATSAYLAGAGRDKIGFSVTGRDAQGRPLHVGGIQGVAERNTMRYFLGIEAFLATLDAAPAQRLEQRLRHFHAALERHPAQLHETMLSEYLALKRRQASRPADAAARHLPPADPPSTDRP